MKGKRQEGAIDKDLQKLIGDLTITKKIDHPQYGYQINVYVNDVSNDVLLDFLRVLFCRLQPNNKPEVLLRFIDELTAGDMEELRTTFGEDTPLCDWEFWKHMYTRIDRKSNGDLTAPVDLKAEEEASKTEKKNGDKKDDKSTK